MKPLIIFAHPGVEGHNTTILSEVKAQVKEYDLIDLYKEKFDPVIRPNELYTSGKYELSEKVKEYQAKLTAADKIIFIYPVWWGSMPAILKGYFDKVFTGHYAFRYVQKNILGYKLAVPLGLLKGKKAVVFNTMGSPTFADYGMLRIPSVLSTKMILGFCGIKAKAYTTHTCRVCDDKRKAEIAKRVKKGLKWLGK